MSSALSPHATNLNPFASLWRHRRLIARLARRDLAARWRGSLLGPIWAIATPIATLAIYGFAFGTVLRARIPTGSDGATSAASHAPYVILLFSGLIFVHLFTEVVQAAPSLVRNNLVYVRQIVFPIEVLSAVSVVCALFGTAMSMAVLFLAHFALAGIPPLTALWLPFLAIPVALFALGASWALSALGLHVRDLAQIVGLGCTAVLFTSTVFYALDAVPPAFQWIVRLNPASTIVDASRTALFGGSDPDALALAIVTGFGLSVCLLGYAAFMRARSGFADVA
jgi:lipopolysaccharide transport system permease protein